MRRHQFFDQGGQWHPVEWRPGRGQLRDLGQNIAAALRLLAQGLEVQGQRTVAIHIPLQFARNQENGRERRSEFMRGGGCQAIELREMLFPRQHQLGSSQCVRQFAGLLGDLECVKTGDANRHQDREPDPEQVDWRQHQRLLALPRQRHMEEDQRGGACDRERAERDRQPDRQRRRRDQHGGKKQK